MMKNRYKSLFVFCSLILCSSLSATDDQRGFYDCSLLNAPDQLTALSDVQEEALILEVINEIMPDQWNQVTLRSSVFITEEMNGLERARIMRAVNAIQTHTEEQWDTIAALALSLLTLPEVRGYGYGIVDIIEEMSSQLQD